MDLEFDMQTFFCVVCKDELSVKNCDHVGQKIICQTCYQQYTVLSLNPLTLQPDDHSYDTGIDNSEKVARARRMERKSRIVDDLDAEYWDEEDGDTRPVSHSGKKRSHRTKRLRNFELDFYDD